MYAAALPLFLTNAILPDAENGSSKFSGLPRGMAYHAGVVDCQIVPPIFPSRHPKSCLIVGGSDASMRLLYDSQPGSAEKSSRTCTRGSSAIARVTASRVI